MLPPLLRSHWLRQLLLAAVVLRALLPAGYMPGVDASGLPTLQLCSVLQPLSQRLADSDSSPSLPGGSRGGYVDGPCPFGAAPDAAPSMAVPGRAAPLSFSRVALKQAPTSAHCCATLLPQQARAPPVPV